MTTKKFRKTKMYIMQLHTIFVRPIFSHFYRLCNCPVSYVKLCRFKFIYVKKITKNVFKKYAVYFLYTLLSFYFTKNPCLIVAIKSQDNFRAYNHLMVSLAVDIPWRYCDKLLTSLHHRACTRSNHIPPS
jgi:hypothetical protein